MKPRPTLADYVIIAISPALIMALVGSLVFFLIELLYQGQYQARLQYVFALFVFAAVLIGRISIEEGRGKAMGFAAVLSAAVLVVMGKFVQFPPMFDQLSWFINVGLIVLILWCADRLTWDCTVIDEQDDASGEGLLQTVGLDEQSTDLESAGDGARLPEPEGTTGAEPIEAPKRTWFQRLIAARNKKHAPGVWVVYFSMAALPIFGIGQGFIFGESHDSRRYVFKLLVVYVAAALGLLLTTSFLGLRRYLRQRRLEMPTQMAGTWLGTGAVMIVGLLLFCMILPRRNAEYSITDLPAFAGSPDDLEANQYGFGNDGPEEDDAERQVAREDAERESGNPGDDEGSGEKKSKEGKGASEPDKSGKQQRKTQGKSKNSQGEKKSSDESGKKSGDKKENSGKQQSDGKQDQQKSDDSRKQQDDPSGEPQSNDEKRQQEQGEQNDKSASEKKRSQDRQSEKSDADQQQRQKQNSRKFDPARLAKQVGGGIGMLLKLLYWLIVIAIVGWFLWRYWEQVREAVRNFIQALREFWENLFGGTVEPTAEAASEQVDSTPPPPPFSDFPDPFQSGLANQLPLDQLIKYSFEAFEAWARERGLARSIDQTPHEFAEHVAQAGTGVSQEAIRLAELYSRAAYSRDTMPQASGQLLQQLWQRLTTT